MTTQFAFGMLRLVRLPLVLLKTRTKINSIAFSPDGKRVVSGSDGHTIRDWDVETGQILPTCPLQATVVESFSVAFSPDGQYLVSGSDDRTIRVWDIRTGWIAAGPFEGHERRIYSVAFSPDGRMIASASGDGTARIWDIGSFHLAAGSFDPQTDPVALLPDGAGMTSTPEHLNRKGNTHMMSSHMKYHLDKMYGSCTPKDLSDCGTDSGWVWSPRPSGIFWVPPLCREALCGMETLSVFGKRTTRLDFSRFVVGTSWAQCHSPTDAQQLSSDLFTEVDDRPDGHLASSSSPIDHTPSSPSILPLPPSSSPSSVGADFGVADSCSPLSDPSTTSPSMPATVARRSKTDEPTSDISESDNSPFRYSSNLQKLVVFVVVPLIAVYYIHTIRNSR